MPPKRRQSTTLQANTTSDLFQFPSNDKNVVARREAWYKMLNESADNFLSVYKKCYTRLLKSLPGVVDPSDFKVFSVCDLRTVWDNIVRAGDPDISEYNAKNKQKYIKQYDNRMRETNVANIVHNFLLAYGLVRDEIIQYKKYTNQGYPLRVKVLKAKIKELINLEHVDINVMIRIVVRTLHDLKDMSYDLLKRLLEFRITSAKNGQLWHADIVNLIQDLDNMTLVDYKAYKITDFGLVLDDEQPHSTDQTITGGSFSMFMTRTETEQSYKEIFRSVFKTQLAYLDVAHRLFLIPNSESADNEFESLICSKIASLIQGKYLAAFVCLQNFGLKLYSTISGTVDDIGNETRVLLDELYSLSHEPVTLCWDHIFKGDYEMVSRTIGYIEAVNAKQTIVGNDNLLYSSGLFEATKKKDYVGVLSDDLYDKTHASMLYTYLCNTIYILTHTSYKPDKTLEPVIIYSVFEEDDYKKMKKIMSIHAGYVSFDDRYVGVNFKNLISHYEKFATLLSIDDTTDTLSFQLKTDLYEGVLSSPYIQLKKAGISQQVSALEVVVEFLEDMVTREIVDDIHISTVVCLTEGDFRILPHLPYKYLKNGYGPKQYQDVAHTMDVNIVLGVVHTEYTAAALFKLHNYFGENNHHRIYSYSLEKDLNPYLDENAVECYTNYFFTTKIYETFEDLALGSNMETVHYAGTTTKVNTLKNMNEKFRLVEDSIDIGLSNKLRQLMPKFTKETVVVIEKIKRAKTPTTGQGSRKNKRKTSPVIKNKAKRQATGTPIGRQMRRL